ncbi:hypothetical protein KA005_10070, partial [bacterium]|nr:hypothetical protein [bacterium]
TLEDSLEDMLRRRVLPILNSRSDEPARRMRCCVQKMISLPRSRLDDEYLTRHLVDSLIQSPTHPSNLAIHWRRSLEGYFLSIRTSPHEGRLQLIVGFLTSTDRSIIVCLHEVNRLQSTESGRFIADWVRLKQRNPNSIYNCYGAQ